MKNWRMRWEVYFNISIIKSKKNLDALDIGYRYIDTASAYGNEHIIGDVLKEYYDAGKLRRSDVFLTTKLPPFAHEPKVAQQFLAKSLKNLHTNYLDLYLIHAPTPCKVRKFELIW